MESPRPSAEAFFVCASLGRNRYVNYNLKMFFQSRREKAMRDILCRWGHLLEEGHPLSESADLTTQAAKAKGREPLNAWLDLHEALSLKGATLSEAMAQNRRFSSVSFCQALRYAEKKGDLASVLKNLDGQDVRPTESLRKEREEFASRANSVRDEKDVEVNLADLEKMAEEAPVLKSANLYLMRLLRNARTLEFSLGLPADKNSSFLVAFDGNLDDDKEWPLPWLLRLNVIRRFLWQADIPYWSVLQATGTFSLDIGGQQYVVRVDYVPASTELKLTAKVLAEKADTP